MTAEKGGAIVIQNKDAYRLEILRQCGNGVFYTLLSHNPTLAFAQKIKRFLEKALEDSSEYKKHEYNFLW